MKILDDEELAKEIELDKKKILVARKILFYLKGIGKPPSDVDLDNAMSEYFGLCLQKHELRK